MKSARRLALAIAPGTLLAGIAGGIVFPIFPIVGDRVGLSRPFIGAILAANRAVRIVAAPLAGLLADRIGARRTLLIGLAVQIVVMGLYVAGMAVHHEGAGFLVGRLLHGPGSACVFVAAQALALEAGGDSGGGMGEAAGTIRVTIVLGIPLGFAIGGILADSIGDFATFAVAGGAVTAAFIAASFTVPDLRPAVAQRGSALAALREVRDLRLLAVGGLNFALAFAGGGMVLTTLALVVDDRHLRLFGHGAEGTSGMLMGIMSIVDAAFTPLAGRLGDRLHAHGRVAAASLALVSIGLVWLGLSDGTEGLAIGIAIVGLGSAGLGPSVLVMLGAIVPRERRGTGAGLLQLCADLGGMLGPLFGTTLITGNTELAFAITAGMVACFIPAALWLQRVAK